MFNSKWWNIDLNIRTASRTDIGVNAIRNAFTFDTVEDNNRKEYTTCTIKKALNSYFSRFDH